MKTYKELFAKFGAIFKGEKSGKLLIVAGVIGIALIFASSFLPKSGEKTETKKEATIDTQYTALLEKELCRIVSEITGSDNVVVMVTLKSGTQNVYANDIKTDTDMKQEGDESGTTQRKDSAQQNCITVEDDKGNKVALLITSLSPSVQGVAVVCEGGGDEALKEQIENAVKTVLDISARRVFVTGKNIIK